MNRRSLFGRIAGAMAAAVGLKRIDAAPVVEHVARPQTLWNVHKMSPVCAELDESLRAWNQRMDDKFVSACYEIPQGFRDQLREVYDKAIQQEELRFEQPD